MMTVWTFMPPFFPIFGSLPTPLKTRLENSVTVVESMILSRPSHPGSPLRRLSSKKCTFGHSVLFPFVLW